MRLLVQTAALVALAAWLLAGCGPRDPRQEVLEQRGRWNVQLLDWVQGADGRITLSTRVSGPPNSALERLTVRFDLQDDQGTLLERRWHVYDVGAILRGGPADIPVGLDVGGIEVAQIAFSQVLVPEPEDEPHIVELQGLGGD